MTTIMLEVPDQLADRLKLVGKQLPQLLNQTMNLAGIPSSEGARLLAMSPFMQEVADFLVSGPTPQAIIAFKASPVAQAQLEELLARNREEILTPQERTELDTIQSANHLLIILKSQARMALQQTP